MKTIFAKNANKLIAIGNIKEKLKTIIYDQDMAIESVKDTISRAIFIQKENRVNAVLFFVGPPATGKTYLSSEVGKLLKEFNFKSKIFDMTMYGEDSSNLIELDNISGNLANYIKENPKALIILDDIEKCHPKIQLDLFKLLDCGYIEDKSNKTKIDASKCIFIVTSNLGKTVYDRNNYKSMVKNQQETKLLILDAISKKKNDKDELILIPQLTSKLSTSNIILFNKVGIKVYFNMSKKEVYRYSDIIENTFGLKLECSDETILCSFLKYLPFFDPQKVKGKIGDDIFDIIREYIQKNSIDISKFKTISIDVDSEVKSFLDTNFIKDIKKQIFYDDKFQELVDKKQTLNLNYKITQSDTILKLQFTTPKIQKIKNLKDFSGDVKVEINIASGKIKGEPQEKIFGHKETKKMLVRISDKIQKFQVLQRQNNPKSKDVLKNIPKGILLYGPPGTGKTKLARAFSAQVECPIIISSGKDMTTIAKIKEIFRKAREYAPSVLFIDELDTIGYRGSNQSNNDKNINTLLEELDGFDNDAYKPVFVIAATNRKDNIDPAIIRAGRIEEHIKIDTLTKDARIEFIDNTIKDDDDFSKLIDTHKFLKYTVAMSGASMEMVFKKAKYKLEILREDQSDESILIDIDFLIDIVNEIKYGKVNILTVDTKFENMLTAYHEAGHAVVSLALNPNLTIEQITITPRSDTSGFVSYNHEDIYRWDKEFYIGKISSAYGGRVAEELYFESKNKSTTLGVSADASSDITEATKMIKKAVLNLGMDNELGLIDYDTLNTSEATKEKVDKVIVQWQNNLKELTKKVLQENWDKVELIVKELLGDETTDGKETIDSQWLDENIYIDYPLEVL